MDIFISYFSLYLSSSLLFSLFLQCLFAFPIIFLICSIHLNLSNLVFTLSEKHFHRVRNFIFILNVNYTVLLPFSMFVLNFYINQTRVKLCFYSFIISKLLVHCTVRILVLSYL